ncbi:hypothetical protein [Nocardia sp. CA-135398]|uniref:hypothetical protein n=1 Tax=Nocardia sp. CA-135398 TaxID=3239977 RepID=UPI003D97F3B7
MELAGDVLEFVGTLVTAYGLFYAWQRLTGRIARWREQFARIGTEVKARLTGRRDATVNATAALAVAAGLSATARAEYPVDSTETLENQVARLIEITNFLRADIDATQGQIAHVRDHPAVTMEAVETAIADALSSFETTQTASTIRDLGWAIGGIGMTAVGIFIGFFA